MSELFHCGADAMAEKPCRLVGNAGNPLQLVGAHAFLGLTEQVDTQGPLPQWKVGVVEDRSSAIFEILSA